MHRGLLLTALLAYWLCSFSLPRRVSPHEPLVLLCIATALLNQAATKKVADRHRAVLQAFAFLQEYGDCRCACVPFSCMIRLRWGMGVTAGAFLQSTGIAGCSVCSFDCCRCKL